LKDSNSNAEDLSSKQDMGISFVELAPFQKALYASPLPIHNNVLTMSKACDRVNVTVRKKPHPCGSKKVDGVIEGGLASLASTAPLPCVLCNPYISGSTPSR